MNRYELLVSWFADEDAFSCVFALILVLGTCFTSFLSLNRIKGYEENPDVKAFKPIESAMNLTDFFSILLLFWIIMAIYYWLAFRHPEGIGVLYKIISFSTVLAVIFWIFVRHKFLKAKKSYNALYLKSSRGNLEALMGNPLGLSDDQQDAVTAILSKSAVMANSVYRNTVKAGEEYSDPLNDILVGRSEIKSDNPASAMETVEEYLKGIGEQTRQCPFCKSVVDKKYPVCIYCGRPIPSSDTNQTYKERNNV